MIEACRRAILVAAVASLVAGCSTAHPAAHQASIQVTTSIPPSTRAPTTAVPPATSARDIVIANVSNFRDAAGSGEGMLLRDGTTMARGMVYRSGRLKDLSEKDKATLSAIGLSDIFDLRTDEVAERSPDPTIDSADYHLINLYAVYSKRTPDFSDPDTARAEREEINREFVSVPAQRAKTAAVLRGIAHASGPVIVHCTEGKDRTGWIAALLQLIAGADEDAVVQEYLLSNSYRRDVIEQEVAKVRQTEGALSAKITRVQWEVDRDYLIAGLNEITERYGNLQGFLTDGLGLDQGTIDVLRAKMRRD